MEMGDKLIMRITVPYKLTSQAILKRRLRNPCERIIFNRFQGYSLQM